MLTDAIDLSTIRRVLVIKLRHHGDVLLTSPLLSVLKNHAPHVEIDALVYQDTQEMLSLHPAIGNIFCVDRAWKKLGLLKRLGYEIRLIKALRNRRYDLLIHLTENPRGPWLARLLHPRFSVAREFTRKRGKLWRNSFSHLYRLPARPRHTVEQHLDALRRLGIYPGQDERRLVLVSGVEAENDIRQLLEQHGLHNKGFIHLHPTSRWLFKCWEVDKYAALIDALQDMGQRVVITAAPSKPEMELVRKIKIKLSRAVVDFSGQLNLKQLSALTAQAKCFVGVDSAPMHIAAAMQTPIVALFGPSGELEWGPWQVTSRVLTSQHPCRPCGLDGCGGGKVSECLSTLAVAEVLSAVRQIINESEL